MNAQVLAYTDEQKDQRAAGYCKISAKVVDVECSHTSKYNRLACVQPQKPLAGHHSRNASMQAMQRCERFLIQVKEGAVLVRRSLLIRGLRDLVQVA